MLAVKNLIEHQKSLQVHIIYLTKSNYTKEETTNYIDFLWNGKTVTSSFEGFAFPQKKHNKGNPSHKKSL